MTPLAAAGQLGRRWSEAFRALRALVAAGQLVREGRGRSARFRLGPE